VKADLFHAVRIARAPMIWWGRRRYADVGERERETLERHAYRRRVRGLWASTAVDPDYLYRADLDSDSVILDVGAFRGEVAQTFVDLYGARVHSFEPEPSLVDLLRERAAAEPRIVVHPFGLGRADARLTMQIDGPASTVFGDDGREDVVGRTQVEIRDAAEVFDELGLDRIDFMKVNIEGGEFDLIERLHETGWLPRIRYVLVQFHEWHDDAYRRRWRARRQLRKSHDEIWNYPWIYELWCSRDRPPPPPLYTPEEQEVIARAIREQFAASQEAAGPTSPPA